MVLLPNLPTLSLLDYGNWRAQQVQRAMLQLKISPLKQSVWQMQAAMVGQNSHALLHVWRRSSLVVAAVAISPQAFVLVHNLKPFSGL
jgi:hypothetical protein